MKNTYIVSASENQATLSAESVEDATQYARNYFGDYRTDCRNTNRVTHISTEEFGTDMFYIFSIEPIN